uniref:Uncharacterized protein n=1 Tax=Arundo donax TaxID=35708 RepID=A0A0A8XN57_ARUDO
MSSLMLITLDALLIPPRPKNQRRSKTSGWP